MYIPCRDPKDTFRLRKCPSAHFRDPRGGSRVAKRTRTTKTTKTIFFNKNHFLEYIFEKYGVGGWGKPSPPPSWEVFRKSDFIVFCVRVGEPHTKNACPGPVL
jgi:hypothetical protein